MRLLRCHRSEKFIVEREHAAFLAGKTVNEKHSAGDRDHRLRLARPTIYLVLLS
jgi:hypothetical protein